MAIFEGKNTKPDKKGHWLVFNVLKRFDLKI